MLIGQLRQNVGVDLAFAEQRHVLIQAESAKPITDVHRPALHRVGR